LSGFAPRLGPIWEERAKSAALWMFGLSQVEHLRQPSLEQIACVLVPRQDLTGADRAWAARYEAGDVLRYSRASKETGIGKGEYARVAEVDAAGNRLTVETGDGTRRTYDPRRRRRVSVYREQERAFAAGTACSSSRPCPA